MKKIMIFSSAIFLSSSLNIFAYECPSAESIITTLNTDGTLKFSAPGDYVMYGWPNIKKSGVLTFAGAYLNPVSEFPFIRVDPQFPVMSTSLVKCTYTINNPNPVSWHDGDFTLGRLEDRSNGILDVKGFKLEKAWHVSNAPGWENTWVCGYENQQPTSDCTYSWSRLLYTIK